MWGRGPDSGKGRKSFLPSFTSTFHISVVGNRLMPTDPVLLRFLARQYITSLQNMVFQTFIVLAFGASAKMLVSKDVLLSTFYSSQALWSRLTRPSFNAPLIVVTACAFPYCFQMLEVSTSSSHHSVSCQGCMKTLPHIDSLVLSSGLKSSGCSQNFMLNYLQSKLILQLSN